MKRKLAGLLSVFLLLSGGGALAADKSFRDLPPTHWAYREITRAVSHGIMNGLGDGNMNPDGTLTWAHYLAMISRTFAPMAYEGARSAGTDWKTAGYQVSANRGYLLQNDFLPVTPSTLNGPISRQDVAVLLSRVLPAAPAGSSASSYATDTPAPAPANDNGDTTAPANDDGDTTAPANGDGDAHMTVTTDSSGDMWLVIDGVSIPLTPRQAAYDPSGNSSDPPLSDFAELDSGHQAAVRRLYDLGIVRGKSDGTFGGTDTVRRCDGAVLLMRTVDAADTLRAGEAVALTFDLVDGDGKPVGGTIEANARIGDSLSGLAAVYAPTGYKVAPQDGKVSAIQSRYALKFAPLTQAEREEIEADARYRQGQISYEEYMAKDFWLRKLGDNARKRLLIFGHEYTEEIPVTEAATVPEGTEAAEVPE
ncbi:MAG: S-layer homology domain-containing protein, partial [Oscillibacter sp.]|nr:S-layer homology domain-containing protein [Oscillibacter sp.]